MRPTRKGCGENVCRGGWGLDLYGERPVCPRISPAFPPRVRWGVSCRSPRFKSEILELPQTWNRYSYVYNRPTYSNDPDGRCPPCIGALVGGAIEGGFDLGKQLYNNGGSLSNVNWREVGADTLGGAVTGGLAVATGGTSLVANAVIGDVLAGATANVVGGIVTRTAEGG